MADTQLKALKQGDQGKHGQLRIPKGAWHLSGSELRGNLVDRPFAERFVKPEQLGEVVKQMRSSASPSPSEGSNTNQHADTPLYASKLRAFKGMRGLYKAGILRELLKLSKPSRKPTIASLLLGLSQYPTHPRAWEPGENESSHPCYSKVGGSDERIPSPPRSVGWTLNCFLRKRGGGDRNCCGPEGKKDNDVDRNTKIITTIIKGIDDNELNTGHTKAQIRKLSPIVETKELKPLMTNHNIWSEGHTSLTNPSQ
ncbi:hypothetical protein Cgig2_003244 [Carnegiea gigantea]|uniref:Uncharacterized protein n=1 Tax=Carnegiea gigantea TaxID=171969 RepID=A0A9Q1GTN1_9CARY|nr:hypothetical protein Cgig2_003244 [Carnegiea gigantea]